MKVQDVRTQSVAENPFDRIDSTIKKSSNSRAVASVAKETIVLNNENHVEDLQSSIVNADKHIQDVEKKRKEVKTALAVLFIMQRTFLAEHNRYTSDVAMMNHDFPEELGFKFGFAKAYSPDVLAEGERPSSTNTDFLLGEPLAQERTTRLQYKAEASQINLQEFLHFCRNKCEVTENSFEAIAVMPIPGGDDVDVFLVNDKKEIFHVYNGMTKKNLTN